jgi:hypothetical protein
MDVDLRDEHGIRPGELQIGRKSCLGARAGRHMCGGAASGNFFHARRAAASKGWAMKSTIGSFLGAVLLCASAFGAPDYGKRAQPLDAAVQARLLGKWTNPVDGLVIEFSSVDLASGLIKGKVSPTSGPAAADEHELIGWVSAAPRKESYDNVVPVTFTTTLYEYGTLPVWAGFLRDDKLITMHYLVWPNRPYSWDHVSTFQETWTKLP